MKNRNRETLFGNLVRGVYALDGINGEFVAALCRPLPFKPKNFKWEIVVLAKIPSEQIRRARLQLSNAKRQITRHRRRFAQKLEAGLVDGNPRAKGAVTTAEAYDKLEYLWDALDTAEARLAQLV